MIQKALSHGFTMLEFLLQTRARRWQVSWQLQSTSTLCQSFYLATIYLIYLVCHYCGRIGHISTFCKLKGAFWWDAQPVQGLVENCVLHRLECSSSIKSLMCVMHCIHSNIAYIVGARSRFTNHPNWLASKGNWPSIFIFEIETSSCI